MPWVHFYTDSGLIYYFNPETGVTSWEVPVDTKLSAQDTKMSVHDTKMSVHDTKVSVQDTKVSVQDTKVSVQDTKASVEDTKESVEDTKESVEDTHNVSSAHDFDVYIQDVTQDYIVYDDGDDVNRVVVIDDDCNMNMNMLQEELNAVVINDEHDGDDDDEDDYYDDGNKSDNDNNNIGRDGDTLIEELSNLVIEEYIEADYHHHNHTKDSSVIGSNGNCLIEQEEDSPTLFKKIRTIKNLDTGEEYVLDDSEEAAMIYDTFASKSSSSGSRSITDGSQEQKGLSSVVVKKKMKVFGIKSLLKKMNMNEQ